MASQNISFEKIGSSNRKPSVLAEFNTRMATRGLPGNRQTTLIIGQKTAAGSLAALTLTNVFSDDEAAQLCGYGSQIHRMVLKTLKANKYSNISIMPLVDAAGAAANWPVTVAGVPTASGVFSLALNDDIIEIATATTDTPTTIAAAIVTAITSRPELAFSAANEAGVATITAKNKGTVANAFKVTVAGTTPGITLAVGAIVPGTIDPDITPALTAAFIGGHDQVVIAYKDAPNVVALRNHIDAVGSPEEKRWALGFVASNGSLATATALSASIGHGFINNPWCRNTTTPTMEIAASYAAVIAANEDPALGYDNAEVKGIAVPLVIDRTSRTEEESALYNGVTPLNVGPGERVQIVRAISTYTVNSAAVPDVAWLDITTPRTMKYVAKVFIEDRARTYLGGKITDRRIQSMHDRGVVLLKMLEDLEIIEAVDDNLDDYIVERDLQDVSRVNERIPVDVVNNLHIIAERFDLLL